MSSLNRRQVFESGLACAAAALLPIASQSAHGESQGLATGANGPSTELSKAGTATGTAGTEAFQTTPGKEPIKRKNRIQQSVSRWCYQKIPLDDLCQAAAQMGLKGIDLLKPEEYEIPRRYGLICTMAYAGGGDINKALNRVENHAEIEAGLRKNLPLVAKAGCPNAITFSGPRDGMSDEEGARNTILGLKRLRPIVEDNGITLCIELLNSKRDHHGYMCDHTEWGVKVLEEVGSPSMKLLYDIYHMQIMEGDLVSTIKAHSQWMGHFHTGGVPGRHELNDTQEVNWAGVMQGILSTGYKGYVAHEFVPTGDPLTSLLQAVNLCDI